MRKRDPCTESVQLRIPPFLARTHLFSSPCPPAQNRGDKEARRRETAPETHAPAGARASPHKRAGRGAPAEGELEACRGARKSI